MPEYNEEEFYLTVGDVVWLKSGSPAMVVEKNELENIQTVWFENKHVVRSYFKLKCLSKTRPVFKRLASGADVTNSKEPGSESSK